jgi:hypothetical protein
MPDEIVVDLLSRLANKALLDVTPELERQWKAMKARLDFVLGLGKSVPGTKKRVVDPSNSYILWDRYNDLWKERTIRKWREAVTPLMHFVYHPEPDVARYLSCLFLLWDHPVIPDFHLPDPFSRERKLAGKDQEERLASKFTRFLQKALENLLAPAEEPNMDKIRMGVFFEEEAVGLGRIGENERQFYKRILVSNDLKFGQVSLNEDEDEDDDPDFKPTYKLTEIPD